MVSQAQMVGLAVSDIDGMGSSLGFSLIFEQTLLW